MNVIHRLPLGPVPLAASIASGLLTAVAFPRPQLWPLVFIGLIPLVLAARRRGNKKAFQTGFTGGLIFNGLLMYWIPNVLVHFGHLNLVVGLVLYLLLAGYLALYFGLFTLGLELAENRFGLAAGGPAWMVFGAVLFTGLEYFKGFFMTGLPWEPLGASLCAWLPLVQAADIAGPGGLTLAVVLVNLAAAGAVISVRGRNRGGMVVSALVIPIVFGLLLGYGWTRLAEVKDRIKAAPTRRVAVVQASIPQDIKWDPDRRIDTLLTYQELTWRVAEGKPDLIVWPETATPFFYQLDPGATEWLDRVVVHSGSPLLFGSPALEKSDGEKRYYNRAYLVDGQGRLLGHYSKTHLVPFGEYVPLKKILFFVRKLTQAAGDFSPGEPGKVLELDGIKLGVLICYESIFTYLSRQSVRNGADYLVIMTNDAWFGRSSAPAQHFSQAVLRAVESRRTLIRAANTGISGIIWPSGEIPSRLELFKRDVIIENAPILGEKTIYTAVGDALPQACLGVAALFFPAAWIRSRKNDRRS